MKKAAAQQGVDLERFQALEPYDVRQEREEQWEERLLALAQAGKFKLSKLPAAKSHPMKSQLAAAMKASCSVSNAWLADRLAIGQPASASQFARRWMLDRWRRPRRPSPLSGRRWHELEQRGKWRRG